MVESPASMDWLYGLATLASVLASAWLGWSVLPAVVRIKGLGEAMRSPSLRLLAWIAVSGAICTGLLPAVSMLLAGVELSILPVPLAESRGVLSAWGVGSYGLSVGLRLALLVAAFALAAALTQAWRRVTGGPQRLALLLAAGGLTLVLGDAVSSGLQSLPLTGVLGVSDLRAGYLAGWAISFLIIALGLLFVRTRLGARPLSTRKPKGSK